MFDHSPVDRRRLLPELWAVAVCAAFLILCRYQAPCFNLWGDEAFSLEFAGLGLPALLGLADVHLPTYYVLLKGVAGRVGELELRMLHGLPFALGLYCGYRTLRLLGGSAGQALAGLGLASLIPAYACFALTIRMYSLLFAATMAFMLAASALCVAHRPRPLLAPMVLTAVLMIQVDLPGVVCYAATVPVLLCCVPRLRHLRGLVWLSLPPLSLLAHAPILPVQLRNLLAWAGGPAGSAKTGLLEQAYRIGRPLFELTSVRGPCLFAAILFPALLGGWLVVSALLRLGSPRQDRLLVWWAFWWLPLAPLGLAVSRALLPSLFFMTALLVRPPAGASRLFVRVNHVLLLLLVGINASYALRPQPGLASRVPWRMVAEQTLELARSRDVGCVVLSANSANCLSIRRYLDGLAERGELRIQWAGPELKAERLPGEPLLFVSHMGDHGHVDVPRVLASSERLLVRERSYVPLARLPYNPWFRAHVTRRARQDSAVIVYRIGAAGAGSGDREAPDRALRYNRRGGGRQP